MNMFHNNHMSFTFDYCVCPENLGQEYLSIDVIPKGQNSLPLDEHGAAFCPLDITNRTETWFIFNNTSNTTLDTSFLHSIVSVFLIFIKITMTFPRSADWSLAKKSNYMGAKIRSLTFVWKENVSMNIDSLDNAIYLSGITITTTLLACCMQKLNLKSCVCVLLFPFSCPCVVGYPGCQVSLLSLPFRAMWPLVWLFDTCNSFFWHFFSLTFDMATHSSAIS